MDHSKKDDISLNVKSKQHSIQRGDAFKDNLTMDVETGISESFSTEVAKPNQLKVNITSDNQNTDVDYSSKYGGLKPQNPSVFLQRKLAKKCQYFDSGDYNMAKAQLAKPNAGSLSNHLKAYTGNKIPKPKLFFDDDSSSDHSSTGKKLTDSEE
ncbi:hypothetical protein GJ496_011809 [Pomphorhynchus laevis]|nr:hypothetical protein GJ496_011809 [Pomphorhynchus laevis]